MYANAHVVNEGNDCWYDDDDDVVPVAATLHKHTHTHISIYRCVCTTQ